MLVDDWMQVSLAEAGGDLPLAESIVVRTAPSGRDVFGEAMFDRVAGQRPAVAGGEQRAPRITVAYAHPHLEHGHGLGGERRDSLLPSLPQGPDVRAGAELGVGASWSEHLGRP